MSSEGCRVRCICILVLWTFYRSASLLPKIMDELPQCALKYIGLAATAANCSIADISCTCENEIFTRLATLCIAGNCTVREAFFTQNQTAVLCHLSPYVDKRYVPVIITFFILTFIVVLMRIFARIVSQAQFGYDDYFNFVAFVIVSTYTLFDVHLSKYGFGVDTWAVPQENISFILRFTLIASNLYFSCRALIRVSILLFYLRIFRTPGAKALIMWTLALVILFGISVLFSIVFQCSPVDYTWQRWDGTHPGHCTDFRGFVWAATVIGIAIDFWTVFVAVRLVSRLQLPMRKKIMVTSMFAVGLIAIAVSIARLPYINQFTKTHNPTVDWVPITIWSALENYIGVICACLPSLPALLKPLSSWRVPQSIKKLQQSNTSSSQRSGDIEHELGSRRYASLNERMPTYEVVTDVYHVYDGYGGVPGANIPATYQPPHHSR
ncbi:hypothetical protein F4808DRAFT_245983 [Astrocystis sublimbata]|nr:hypothetical protein F4808DRAFT_245983 [Astrocystis sublimbata]